jgi:hypothetical protein
MRRAAMGLIRMMAALPPDCTLMALAMLAALTG